LQWGEVPDDSIANVEEWAFYLSLDGETASTSTTFTVAVSPSNSYQIEQGTAVGFNRYFLMFGRNGGGDGHEFSAAAFRDLCALCVADLWFENESTRNYHIRGEVLFNAPQSQRLIHHYSIFVGRDPVAMAAPEDVGAIKVVEKAPVAQYRVDIPEMNVDGMPYLWVASFYDDGGFNETPTGDLASVRIEYRDDLNGEVLSAERELGTAGSGFDTAISV